MQFKIIFAIILFKLISKCYSYLSPNPEREPIHFNSDGKFKIITFADLHYGEGPDTDWGPKNDEWSTKVMTDILEWEKPDFVVYTGDLMSAENFYPNGSAYVDILLKPVVEGNYKWASTYGNHDIGNNVTREEILSTEQKYNLSYTQQGADGVEGTTNYYLPIYAPISNVNGTEQGPVFILWFFDSRGGRNRTGGIPAYVHETVIEWFKTESSKIEEQWGTVPSFAYFHYPTDEYKPIHDNLADYPECTGQRDDIVTPQEKNTGLMQALLDSKMVKATFIGHNHGNGWCCYYESMSLCYNRQSGHGGGWVGWVRGARVVEISLNDTWGQEVNYIRLETGEIVDKFPRQV